MKQTFILCGVAAAIVYLTTTIIGGLVTPGYSHIINAVSELTKAGAPLGTALAILYGIYNLAVALFCLGGILILRGTGTRLAVAGFVIQLPSALLGILSVTVFPMDPLTGSASVSGTVHLVLAGVMSLASMLAMILVAVGLRRLMPRFSVYSLISFAFVLVTGGLASLMIVQQIPLTGLFERLTIGGYMQWIAGVSLVLWSHARRAGRNRIPGAA